MAFLSFSFDDGRDDNYRVAFKIMKEYNLKGTIHVTTGFVDGSWKPQDWYSAGHPITLDKLREMRDNGFEISSHGDKHISNEKDLLTSIDKLKKMALIENTVGFSVPGSLLDGEEKNAFIQIIKKNNIAYMRCGRNPQCYSLKNKIYFVLYSITKIRYFYYRFNTLNCIDTGKPINRYNLYSVVVRKEDDPALILDFLRSKVSQDVWIILMLHSIIDRNEKNFGKDQWCWEAAKFEMLCKNVQQLENDGLTVMPILQTLRTLTEMQKKRI